MLTILFKILEILGILLLLLLGIALGIVLLVLFFPVSYKALGEKTSEEVQISAKLKWLFGFLRVQYSYPVPGKILVKCLFFTLYDSSAEKKVSSGKKGKRTSQPEQKPAAPTENTVPPKNQNNAPRQDGEETSTTEEASKSAAQETNRFIRMFHKIRDTVQKICDRIKHILQEFSFYRQLWNDPDTQELLKYAGKQLGHILKRLRPRRLTINAVIGTGSPDTTGYLYGIYGMLLPKLGKDICITPDFEQAVLEGNFRASGHFTLACVLFRLGTLFLDKRLQQLRTKIKQFENTQKKESL